MQVWIFVWRLWFKLVWVVIEFIICFDCQLFSSIWLSYHKQLSRFRCGERYRWASEGVHGFYSFDLGLVKIWLFQVCIRFGVVNYQAMGVSFLKRTVRDVIVLTHSIDQYKAKKIMYIVSLILKSLQWEREMTSYLDASYPPLWVEMDKLEDKCTVLNAISIFTLKKISQISLPV